MLLGRIRAPSLLICIKKKNCYGCSVSPSLNLLIDFALPPPHTHISALCKRDWLWTREVWLVEICFNFRVPLRSLNVNVTSNSVIAMLHLKSDSNGKLKSILLSLFTKSRSTCISRSTFYPVTLIDL